MEYATAIRITSFFIILIAVALWEKRMPLKETNSNYGFNLSVWDRLFGTYLPQPAKGHQGMTIGLSQFRDHRRLTLPWLLILPFVGDVGKQPINK
jgi:hypothetical protein